MPTSVLLAVLVAAGLLALAPALVRRYDATERLAAERESSTARVLSRRRRRRTVPGRTPLNPPLAHSRSASDTGQPAASQGHIAAEHAAGPGHASRRVRGSAAPGTAPEPEASGSQAPEPAGSGTSPAPAGREDVAGQPEQEDAGRAWPPDPAERRRWWHRRRRRVLCTLLVLVTAELSGTALVGPGFLVGLTMATLLLFCYIAILRHNVVLDQRRRQRLRQLAAQREARLAAERRRLAEKQRRMEEARRYARRLAAQADRQQAEDTVGPVPGVRGQSYQARAG